MGKNKEPSYEKKRVMKSAEFDARERDMLHALLAEDREYTVSEAKTLLKNERERVIK